MSKNLLRTTVATLALASALVDQAVASPFYATYETDTGHVVAFLVDGTIQAGGDVIVATDMLMTPTVNGVASPVANFLWANTPFTDGFVFDDATLTAFGAPVYAGGPSFGDTLEPFGSARWSLVPVQTFDATYETSAGDLLAFSFYGLTHSGNDTSRSSPWCHPRCSMG